MVDSADIRWFRQSFGGAIDDRLAGTVLDVDMLVALACQESGELWSTMRRKNLAPERIAALCCGDTLDADRGRSAFPKTKAELVACPRGAEMFAIARKALLDMAEHIPAYGFARNRPNKFCHGFGVFQCDLQFFRTNPDYFLEKRYERFEASLDRAVPALESCLAQVGLGGRSRIGDPEFAHVAIAYNTGRFVPERGLRQGHRSGGKFYGEWIHHYLALARAVGAPEGRRPGLAIVPPPQPLEAARAWFRVDTLTTSLRLRREPRISTPKTANVIAELPDGHRVRAVDGTEVDGFIEVETVLGGATFRGFAASAYLVGEQQPEPQLRTPGAPSAPRLPAVEMPRRDASPTKRRDVAGAHALNEPGMPARSADDAEGLRQDLHAIVAWLAVDNAAHERYRPRSGLTFCNIYAHDYCRLAGAYLPRVWWTAPAIVRLSRGETVRPLYGDTVVEMRANDLFRWLRDFGHLFGWRQSVSPTELQTHANEGAVCLIVARRKEDGRSGHIVPVVPEGEGRAARRNAAGEVTAPLQSQAGLTNFRYGTGTAGWWRNEGFAEHAFWVHA